MKKKRELTEWKDSLREILFVIGVVCTPVKENFLDRDVWRPEFVHQKQKQLRSIFLCFGPSLTESQGLKTFTKDVHLRKRRRR